MSAALCPVHGGDLWQIANGTLACASCKASIGAGEAYRPIAGGRSSWCQDCALEHLGEHPPDRIWNQVRPTLPKPLAEPLFGDVRGLARRVNVQGIRDGKLAALGRDE